MTATDVLREVQRGRMRECGRAIGRIGPAVASVLKGRIIGSASDSRWHRFRRTFVPCIQIKAVVRDLNPRAAVMLRKRISGIAAGDRVHHGTGYTSRRGILRQRLLSFQTFRKQANLQSAYFMQAVLCERFARRSCSDVEQGMSASLTGDRALCGTCWFKSRHQRLRYARGFKIR